MADRQGLDLLRRPGRERGERHELAGRGRADIDLVEVLRIALQVGQDLHDDVVAVLLREILRHLALAEGIVKRVVDRLRGEPEARRAVAVDVDRQRRSRHLLIGRDVAQLR